MVCVSAMGAPISEIKSGTWIEKKMRQWILIPLRVHHGRKYTNKNNMEAQCF
jgi:hypothetical protein